MKTTLVVLLLAIATVARAQAPASWTNPVDPVRIAGNIYYVGSEELGAYLIAGKEGLILLDVPDEKNVELVLRNVRKLGFDPRRIEILIGSHAHLDHIGGFAEVKRRTGAKVYLSPRDAQLAARGGKGDFAFGDTLAYPPVQTDRFVRDGEPVRLGDITMTPLLTPGHTRGCTTWRTTVEEEGKQLDVVFLCSVTAPGYRLVDNPVYPEIFHDYRRSIERLRTLSPDIFLSNHGGFFSLTEKLAKKKAGGPNPFIVPSELALYLDRAWSDLQAVEARQRAGQ